MWTQAKRLANLETIKKKKKLQNNLQRQYHPQINALNAKYKFLYTSVAAQNTSFNLTNNKNKKPHFALITLFSNVQTELIGN